MGEEERKIPEELKRALTEERPELKPPDHVITPEERRKQIEQELSKEMELLRQKEKEGLIEEEE